MGRIGVWDDGQAGPCMALVHGIFFWLGKLGRAWCMLLCMHGAHDMHGVGGWINSLSKADPTIVYITPVIVPFNLVLC